MGAWHTYSAQQAIAELETDRTRGLTQAEAERRLERYGPNRLERVRRPGLLRRLWGQLTDPMVLVLLAVKWIDPFAPRTIPVPDTPDWITVELLPLNEYSRPGTPLEKVNGIVVHYVGNPGTTAEQNHSYFENLAQTGETYASSHFLVGLDGEIIQNVPLNEIAYCSNERNDDTISIECCHPDDSGAFTQATYDSLVRLTRWLMEEYGLESGQVIRHYDVTGKICPKSFVEHPQEWEQFLADLSQ